MQHEIRTTGVVLAAGRSTRMGRPKALLRFRGEALLDRAVRILAEGGCADVVVVIDPEQDALAAAAGNLQGARVVAGRPEGMPIDSLRAALPDIPRDHNLAVLPIDAAVAGAASVAAVIAALGRSAADIVIAAYGEEYGHPVALDASLRPRLESDELPEGIRSLYADADLRCIALETGDPATLADIDTPEDARSWLDPE